MVFIALNEKDNATEEPSEARRESPISASEDCIREFLGGGWTQGSSIFGDM